MTSLLVRMRAIEQATTDEKVLEQIRDVRNLVSDAYAADMSRWVGGIAFAVLMVLLYRWLTRLSNSIATR